MAWSKMRLISKMSSVTPGFFYVFSIILSFSTCSQSLKKICTWEILGMNVLKEGQGFAQNTHGSHSVLGNSLEIVLPSFFFLKLGAINIHDMNIEKMQ